jgi:hypothetical protein
MQRRDDLAFFRQRKPYVKILRDRGGLFLEGKVDTHPKKILKKRNFKGGED